MTDLYIEYINRIKTEMKPTIVECKPDFAYMFQFGGSYEGEDVEIEVVFRSHDCDVNSVWQSALSWMISFNNIELSQLDSIEFIGSVHAVVDV